MSEPGLRLRCSDVFRERKRDSEVGYETGKDRAAFCLSRLSSDEVAPLIISSLLTLVAYPGLCSAVLSIVSLQRDSANYSTDCESYLLLLLFHPHLLLFRLWRVFLTETYS